MKRIAVLIYKILLLYYMITSSINPLLANKNNTGFDTIQLNIYTFNNIPYISLSEFINKHMMYSKYYETKDKIELTDKNNNKIYLSPFLSYCKINSNIYHLTYPILLKKNKLFIPMDPFYKNLIKANLPFQIINNENDILSVITNIYNINGIAFENKKNGTLITLKTTKTFSPIDISSSISSNNWLNLTILDAKIDSSALHKAEIKEPAIKLKTVQLKESGQISLMLNETIDDIDLNFHNNEILILLRKKINPKEVSMETLRSKWLIDTIVIDAGHGGKDPGAIGKNHIKEKDVTLAISKKLGTLLKKELNVKVIYTREDDTFVPLWKRTKIANQSGGKLFISIHANSAPKSPKTHGYETYLLRSGKTQEAIAVAERENAVIELERNQNKYKEMKENFIIAALAQNSFMKESEDFASLIQKNLNRLLYKSSKNRGVKQAGFHVLVGASMPNVLIEVGFLSNKNEENNLTKKNYQNKISQAIFSAIKEFKIKYEKQLINNNEQ